MDRLKKKWFKSWIHHKHYAAENQSCLETHLEVQSVSVYVLDGPLVSHFIDMPQCSFTSPTSPSQISKFAQCRQVSLL